MTSEFVVAVHAIVFLKHKGKSMTSEEISENVCTNPARVRKIMSKLKKAGLVETKEGAAKGGYEFVGNPDETTLLTIFNAIDEKVVNVKWRSGNTDMKCLIASGMSEVTNNVEKQLNSRCNEVLGKTNITDVEKELTLISKREKI